MSVFKNFDLVQDRQIEEIASRGRLFRHKATGAELLSIENTDEHKVFGITFRTPPADSTGVAHILEHSVLCGSRKYPLKEPFVEMIKGSLRTYLNALTYPDKTSYPAASLNTQDFYNLIDVYLDAVFYPRLSREIFQQEGWHYELDTPDQPLHYKGVVFNEMKGAYGSPDRLLSEYSRQSLFPNTPYGVASGGNPVDIPNLTYEQFRAFHQQYYHPSNARIFFYGDDDPEERLRIVQTYLQEFAPQAINSIVPIQQPFATPKRLVQAYPVDPRSRGEKRGMMTINWLLPGCASDAVLSLSYQMLGYILVGMLASPLRKALIESGLGDDLVGAGMATGLRQIYFSTGLKGIAIEDEPAIEAVIFDCLQQLVNDGIDPETTKAAVNTFEFYMRENNTGSSPRGLTLMMRALMTWLHDGDPIVPLAFEAPLAKLKTHLTNGERYFEGLIDHYLLKNTHRTTLLLQPDTDLAHQQAAEERTRLDAVRATMSDADIQQIVETTRHIKLMQETPDPPEALATIPMLQLSDLDTQNKLIPLAVDEEAGTPILYHDLPTTGIVYLDIGFDLHKLPQELVPYAILFGRLVREMGTEHEDYTRLSQRIGSTTGGIRAQPVSMAIRDYPVSTSWLFLRTKVTVSRLDDLLHILEDMLLSLRLDNQERFRQIVLEAKARKESSLIPGGSGFVNMRLRSCFNESDWVNETIGGVSHLFFLRSLVQELEHDWQGVLQKLQQVRQILFSRGAMLFNVTVDGKDWQQVRPKLATFLAQLPAQQVPQVVWQPTYGKGFEGLTAPSQVNFVGKAANLYTAGYERHGSMGVITNYLRTTWLWDRVRVQGGAYGCFCRFGRYSGAFVFVSYRDPNVLDTLRVYDQTAHFLRETSLSQDEVTRSIIGAISHFDTYQFPDAKGFTSMLRYLTGHTDEIRQQKREEILGTTAADFRRFAEMMDYLRDHGIVGVLGSPEAIAAANAEQPGLLEPLRVL
jgi:Zn-dependent M16 (insulinase) family peptidase